MLWHVIRPPSASSNVSNRRHSQRPVVNDELIADRSCSVSDIWKPISLISRRRVSFTPTGSPGRRPLINRSWSGFGPTYCIPGDVMARAIWRERYGESVMSVWCWKGPWLFGFPLSELFLTEPKCCVSGKSDRSDRDHVVHL